MKKVLSFVLACMICVGLASPASAATYDVVQSENETPTTWEFNRTYKDYYELDAGYQLVVQDPNYDIFDDRYVTVSLLSSDGPTEMDVKVSWKKDSASTWESSGTGKITSSGTACNFTIKENYTFKVEAKAVDGKSGYATIQVVLK